MPRVVVGFRVEPHCIHWAVVSGTSEAKAGADHLRRILAENSQGDGSVIVNDVGELRSTQRPDGWQIRHLRREKRETPNPSAMTSRGLVREIRPHMGRSGNDQRNYNENTLCPEDLRHECERACERVANWIKADKVDANKGNAMLNAIGKVLQSKTDTENMELKVADRELLRRIQEMEERVGVVEDAAGVEGGTDGRPWKTSVATGDNETETGGASAAPRATMRP